MTNEERDLIAQFVSRVGGTTAPGFSRSVPSTQPALPPIDPEADRFIAEQFQQHPEARYRVTQMAVVQEAALAEAGNRIQRLQAELQQMQSQMQAQAQAPQKSGGLFSGLFGGGAQPQQPQQGPSVWNQGRPQGQPQYGQQQPPMQPQYAQGPQGGMFQPSASGSGFLGGALKTAAGVAGGVVAGNLLMDMFSGHGAGGMGGGFGGMGGGFGGGAPSETIINNNYGDAGQQGGADWDNATQGGGNDPGWDNATQGNDPGWSDNSGGGGFDDNSGGGGGFDDNSSL